MKAKSRIANGSSRSSPTAEGQIIACRIVHLTLDTLERLHYKDGMPFGSAILVLRRTTREYEQGLKNKE